MIQIGSDTTLFPAKVSLNELTCLTTFFPTVNTQVWKAQLGPGLG